METCLCWPFGSGGLATALVATSVTTLLAERSVSLLGACPPCPTSGVQVCCCLTIMSTAGSPHSFPQAKVSACDSEELEDQHARWQQEEIEQEEA